MHILCLINFFLKDGSFAEKDGQSLEVVTALTEKNYYELFGESLFKTIEN